MESMTLISNLSKEIKLQLLSILKVINYKLITFIQFYKYFISNRLHSITFSSCVCACERMCVCVFQIIFFQLRKYTKCIYILKKMTLIRPSKRLSFNYMDTTENYLHILTDCVDINWYVFTTTFNTMVDQARFNVSLLLIKIL